jgi:hypothetical protein
MQILETAKGVDNLFGNAIAKVLVITIGADIHKG